MAKDLDSLIKRGMGMRVVEPSEYSFDDWNGRLMIWEPPKSGEAYALGVDPAEGVGADRSVCEVIKIGNLHHPDVQVAEFACDFLDPIDFSSVIHTIGNFYSEDDGTEAFCTVECNAPCGDSVLNDLQRRLDYSNLFIWKAYDKITNVFTNKLGWWTNRTTRPKIIARGLHAMTNGDLIINSPYLMYEMEDFERDHFIAKAKARFGRHDDRIMALLIGYWGAHDSEWLAGEDIAEERRLRRMGIDRQEALIEKHPVRRKADYQNSAISARAMWDKANEQFYED